MSSTNKTSNYELSQFLGTDKPAWLSDYNTDMSKIDAQMKLNADGVTAATGASTTNTTSIGTLSNLTTDEKTSLVAAVNEVDSHADSAGNLANSANTTANAAKTEADGLAAFINLSSITSYTTLTDYSTNKGSMNQAKITVARNVAGTLAKVYGYVIANNLNAQTGTLTMKLNVDTGLRPAEKITVDGTSMCHLTISGGGETTVASVIKIDTDGTIEFETDLGSSGNMSTAYIRPLACMIYVTNFGD